MSKNIFWFLFMRKHNIQVLNFRTKIKTKLSKNFQFNKKNSPNMEIQQEYFEMRPYAIVICDFDLVWNFECHCFPFQLRTNLWTYSQFTCVIKAHDLLR